MRLWQVKVVLGLTVASVTACDPPPPKMVASMNDSVPVNSGAEERLKGTTPKPPASAEPEPAASATPSPPTSASMTAAPTPDPEAKLTKAECKRLFDKYIDLTIASTAGLTPEAIKQMKAGAKAQAASKKNDPCTKQEVSRTQFTCAVASKTTAAWSACMK